MDRSSAGARRASRPSCPGAAPRAAAPEHAAAGIPREIDPDTFAPRASRDPLVNPVEGPGGAARKRESGK